MTGGAAFRGQPLLLLGGLLLGWCAFRVLVWQPLLEQPRASLAAAEPGNRAAPVVDRAQVPATGSPQHSPVDAVPPLLEPLVPTPLEPPAWSDTADLPVTPIALGEQASLPPAPRLSARAAVGHNLLLVAGFAQMEIPPVLAAFLERAAPPTPGVPAAAPMLVARQAAAKPSRWTADAWLLLRRDETAPLLSVRESYGRSQAGAVLRYSLAAASAHRPQAYVRASTALAGAREQELAVGVSARPLGGLPLRLALEGRLVETGRGTDIRPAAYAVTEFPPLRLPLGMRAEAYAQGGYVGGEFRTAFVDGQARIDRPLARRGAVELRAGVGVWGGAQRDAARLDVGPSATATFRLGEGHGRVAADYRFRIAGDARPASGPALTVSAGF